MPTDIFTSATSPPLKAIILFLTGSIKEEIQKFCMCFMGFLKKLELGHGFNCGIKGTINFVNQKNQQLIY